MKKSLSILTASLMSAPASLACAKLLYPGQMVDNKIPVKPLICAHMDRIIIL